MGKIYVRNGRERLVLIGLLILLGLTVSGESACQKDYDFASEAGISPTPTATLDDDDGLEPEPSETATPTESITPTASQTSVPTSEETATPTTEGSVGLLRSGNGGSLNNQVGIGREILDSLSQLNAHMAKSRARVTEEGRTTSENWLGGLYNEEIAGSALDQDGDGFTDQLEIDFGSDSRDPSSTPPLPVSRLADRLVGLDDDVDGLSNGEELSRGTNPNLADTDGDGFGDGTEVWSGYNPLDANSYPVDSDGDGLGDAYESQLGINYQKADTDQDGLSDGLELVIGSDPLNNDSDADGILDGKEVELGSDPTIHEMRG